MAANNFEWDEYPLTISRHGTRFTVDLDLAYQAAVGGIALDDMSLADALILDQFEPVAGGAVKALALTGNQTGDNLVEDAYLVGIPEFQDIVIIG